jgi:CHAD domain-containing protein
MDGQSAPSEQTSQPESINDTTKPDQKPGERGKPLPRVRKYPEIKPTDTIAEAGRKILRFHFAHMLSHEAGTRLGEDIEELHDMRVATRRMRAAFDVLGGYFKPKVVRKCLKRLRAAGRNLGRVRDLDVFMEKTGEYLETLPDHERTGLDPLMKHWEQERRLEREKLIAYLDSKNYQLFKMEFNQYIASPEKDSSHLSETRTGRKLVKFSVPVIIYTHLSTLRAYDPLLQNATVNDLHALRIETKKLRYALEFFHEVLGKEAKQVIGELKIIQDHLGNLNDADVACQTLSAFIEMAEARPNERLLNERQTLAPAKAYLASKHAEQDHLVASFPKIWKHFNRRENLRNIALSVSGL